MHEEEAHNPGNDTGLRRGSLPDACYTHIRTLAGKPHPCSRTSLSDRIAALAAKYR